MPGEMDSMKRVAVAIDPLAVLLSQPIASEDEKQEEIIEPILAKIIDPLALSVCSFLENCKLVELLSIFVDSTCLIYCLFVAEFHLLT